MCNLVVVNECEIEKLNKKDYLTPPDPLTFQGVELHHMIFRCINCNQCDDVCPMEIPLSKLYYKLQKKYREKTGYTAGLGGKLTP